jgi:hypothetical protein
LLPPANRSRVPLGLERHAEVAADSIWRFLLG